MTRSRLAAALAGVAFVAILAGTLEVALFLAWGSACLALLAPDDAHEDARRRNRQPR